MQPQPSPATFHAEIVGSVIAVIDQDQGRSVTNDAAQVIATLAQHYDLASYRVIYRDTTGTWDELVVADDAFAGFRSINETDFDAAYAKVTR